MNVFWCVIIVMSLMAVGCVLFPLLSMSASQRKTCGLFFIGIAVCVPICALMLYAHWGSNTTDLASMIQTEQHVAAFREQFGDPNEVIARMKTYLKIHPDRAEAWYLLGRLYLSQGKHTEALQALTKARHLSGGM